jgi:hypothetical protein
VVRVCGSRFKPEFMYQMQSDDMIQVQYAVIQSCRHATIAVASGRKGPPQQREIPVAGNTECCGGHDVEPATVHGLIVAGGRSPLIVF